LRKMRHPSRSDKLKTFLEEDWLPIVEYREFLIKKDSRFVVSYQLFAGAAYLLSIVFHTQLAGLQQ
jgi:hypothetical protein